MPIEPIPDRGLGDVADATHWLACDVDFSQTLTLYPDEEKYGP